jgi:threonine synthase
MMEFVSTRGQAPPTALQEAVLRGLAPDGGLYMPRVLPALSSATMAKLAEKTWPEIASDVVTALLSAALDPVTLGAITADALNFPLPLVQLQERIYVLELFRGPTLAFKDVGARFMARLLAHYRQEADPPLTVLTATSGDTGGAVAHAFLGLPGIRVVVLFPDGKVTPRQERQFSTLGGNVTAVAVQGDFDDCQRMTKEAFQEQARLGGQALTSANSINIGRFLPQTTYFIEAWARLRAGNPTRADILISVPSGNFGNLAAGLLAKRMGMTGVSFLAATNLNDGVPEYLRTGQFTPRPSTPTLSTAMDVGDPSNLARILHLYGGSVEGLRKDLVGRKVTDTETQASIQRVHGEAGYILDPHSAVGFAALERELETRPDATGVLIATAHPAKFAEVVEPVIGQTLPIPPELAQCLEGRRRVVSVEPRLDALKEVLQGESK